MKTRIGLLVVLISLAACGLAQRGSSTQAALDYPSDVVATPDCTSTTCLTPYARQDLDYSVTPVAAVAGDAFVFTNCPAWATCSTTTGVIAGIPPAGGSFGNINITKTNAGVVTNYGPYLIFVQGDPLRVDAWHLQNTGQNSFSASGGTSGEDIAVLSAWRQKDSGNKNVLGTGVKVAVSDTGAEIEHQDLKPNIVTSTNRNYSGSTVEVGGDPTNTTDTNGDHGTSVSGLVAAAGWNGAGSRGVAPEASLSVFNFLLSSQSTAFLIDQASGAFDVFNQSWGVDIDAWEALDPNYVSQIRDSIATGRGGKGSVFVRAAGNSFFEAVQNPVYWSRPSNASADNALPYMIVVGATNASGRKSSYSSAGSNIWVSAPGGEFGTSSPAMITTDQASCSRGYSKTGATSNSFEAGGTNNPNCNYTSIFNGTSSATPVTTGVVALMFQANPNLTWRDVKHILANNSDQIDAAWPDTDAAVYENRPWDPAGYQYEQPWITNAAGYKFHNWYGFGRINANKAVAAALVYNTNLGTYQSVSADSGTTNLNLAIPDNSATGVTHTLAISSSLTVEEVTVRVGITHTWVGDLAVELTSPSGTKSILFNINNSFRNSDWSWNGTLLPGTGTGTGVAAAYTSPVFESNAFYGETANGNWTIKVLDGNGGDTGTLNRWLVTVYGH